MKGKEYIAVGIAILLAAVCAYAAHGASQYAMSLLLNLASTFVGIAIGLALVNVYLDMSSRRLAIRPLLRLVTPSIAKHHNELLTRGFARFGKPQFLEMIQRYAKNGNDPRALTPDERTKLYEMVKQQKDDLSKLYEKLEAELRELTLILGWSFDPYILGAIFSCRYAIVKMKALTFDDSDQCKLDVCEQFLDIDGSAAATFDRLVRVIGLRKDQVYKDQND